MTQWISDIALGVYLTTQSDMLVADQASSTESAALAEVELHPNRIWLGFYACAIPDAGPCVAKSRSVTGVPRSSSDDALVVLYYYLKLRITSRYKSLGRVLP